MKRTSWALISFAAFVLFGAGLPVFGQESEERELSRERLPGQGSGLERSQVGRQLQNPPVPEIRSSAVAEIQRILEEKTNRTPAQHKLDSHLHFAGQVARGAMHVETMPSLANVNSALEFNERGTVHVDIQGTVNAALLAEIAALGGTIESSHPKYRAIRAWIPLLNAERLAERSDVTFIEPAAKAFHNSPLAAAVGAALGRLPIAQRTENVQKQLEAALRISASHEASSHRIKSSSVTQAIVDTSGVVSEGADLVQSQGVTGTGVKVGVMSDGVKSLAILQAAGDLPAVTVLRGQSGPPTRDEGTAMLEIVHDLAPGATLFFATADTGVPQFATNILNLAAAGCQIIVDDLTYFNEGTFQDGVVAQAVNTVTGSGVLYFSSAANSGNLDSGTSGTWEGDFNGTGAPIPIINTAERQTVTVHAFDSTHNYDAISVASSSGGPVTLKWSDPLGAACNDYDLFILDSTLSTVLDSSTNPQTCTQDPYEETSISPHAGDRIVVVLFSGSTRALHVDTERAQLAISTSGATFGHNAAGSALTVAATRAQTTIFTNANQSPETYSSDGPRKIFFNPNGTAITPGNFLFGTGGGTTLAKVDFTAADCGQSAVPGFNPFCGTSAAAPTAASIAALVLSANPSLTPSAVKSAMKSTALAANAGFNARTVGAGIVMANLAVNAVVPVAVLSPASVSFRTQPVATGSAQSAVSLINTGLGPLTINSITIAGANSGDFSVGQSCPNPLGPGANCLLGVTFTPTAAGPRKSSISVSDSAAGSPHTVVLTGVGTTASLSPTSLPFGNQTVNTSSTAQTITLTNKGGVTMNLWQIAILGANVGDFSLSPPSTCGSTLGTGANCTVSVTFKPTAPGARTASVLFSDDGGGSPQAVSLTGTGM